MRWGPTKMVIFGHGRGGGMDPTPPPPPEKLPFLGKIFKFRGGGGGVGGGPVPPLDPRMPPYARRSAFSWVLLYCIRG